jgi:hypothetical protein
MIALILFVQLEVRKHLDLKPKLNIADLDPVQVSFQRFLRCLFLRLIEQITLIILEMVFLFLFLHLMKVQYTVISDPDPRLAVNP